MDQQAITDELKKKFETTQDHFLEELKKLRTGRAHSSMVDGLMVEAYGTMMPLNQLATISTPEAQLLQVTPFDPNNLQLIAGAIRDNQSLGLNPVDDGRVIRLSIPALTSERREQIVKQLHERLETSLISLRNSRHEAIKEADQLKRQKQMSEDDYERFEKKVDEQTTYYKTELEKIAKVKEQDILTV